MTITLSQQEIQELAKAFWKLEKVVKKEEEGGEIDAAHRSLREVLRAHHIVDDWGNIWEDHKV